jgi:hypothetical protein
MVLALPVSLALALISAMVWAALSEKLAAIWFVLGAIVFLVIVGLSVREQWHDPLLIVGRVTGGVLGTEIEDGEEMTKAYLSTWLMYGYVRKFEIAIDHACRLRADGSLEEDAAKARESELGARRLVHRWVVPNEACVLICGGNGAALAQLTDLPGSAAAPAPGAAAEPVGQNR